MKSLLALLVFAAGPVLADDVNAVLKQEAGVCMTAVVKNDYEAMVRTTHPRVVELMGGKESALAQFKEAFSHLKEQGVTMESFTLGEPGKLQKAGGLLAAVIPVDIILRLPAGRARMFSEIVGVSEDEGKTWRFVDASLTTDEHLYDMFPEMKDIVRLSPKKEPVAEP